MKKPEYVTENEVIIMMVVWHIMVVLLDTIFGW